MVDTVGIRLSEPKTIDERFFVRPGTVTPAFATPVPGFEDHDTVERRGGGGGPLSATSRVNTQPAETGTDLIGIRLGGFYELFWRDRVHVLPTRFQAGNVLSDIQSSFDVYNAGTRFIDIRRVLSISDLSADGINITLGNVAVPYTLGLGVTESYTYIISSVGPANINAAYVFDFSGATVSLAHTITGQRVVVFNFKPQERMLERWKWRTDIIKHAAGTEQRNSVRDVPRQQLLHEFLFGDEQLNRSLENLLYGRAGSIFGLPYWRDFVHLTSPAAIDDTVINVTSTTAREFVVGQNAILRNTETGAFEVGDIVSLTDTLIGLSQPLLNAWSVATTEVMPVKLSRIEDQYRQKLWAVNASSTSIVFNVLEASELADQTGFTLYKGDPIYNDLLLFDSDTYERTYEHGLVPLDLQGLGLTFQEKVRDFADVPGTLHLAEFVSRTEFNRLRGFMHARRGRQRRFWSSTRRPDFTPVGVTAAAGTTVNAVFNNYAQSVFPGGSRVNIEIEYVDGSIDRREITSAVVASGNEELILDSGISQEWSVNNVARVSYLMAYRLDVDELEFVHDWYFNGFLRFAIREIKS